MSPKNRAAQWFCQTGVLLFTALYLLAAKNYPGGSKMRPSAIGFDWLRNYWCDLLDAEAKLGPANPARPIAVAAMLLMCAVLVVFFWAVPKNMGIGARLKNATGTFGTVSMATALLFLTKWHTTAIIASGVFGVAAMAGVFFGLWKSGERGLLRLGWACLFLVVANNFIYFTGNFLVALPVVQKVSFAAFLFWVFKTSARG